MTNSDKEMNLNLTEAEIMELVERYVLASNAWENALCTNDHFAEARTEFEETKNKIQAIAKEYEKRGKERDKLLRDFKALTCAVELFDISPETVELCKKTIAECE